MMFLSRSPGDAVRHKAVRSARRLRGQIRRPGALEDAEHDGRPESGLLRGEAGRRGEERVGKGVRDDGPAAGRGGRQRVGRRRRRGVRGVVRKRVAERTVLRERASVFAGGLQRRDGRGAAAEHRRRRDRGRPTPIALPAVDGGRAARPAGAVRGRGRRPTVATSRGRRFGRRQQQGRRRVGGGLRHDHAEGAGRRGRVAGRRRGHRVRRVPGTRPLRRGPEGRPEDGRRPGVLGGRQVAPGPAQRPGPGRVPARDTAHAEGRQTPEHRVHDRMLSGRQPAVHAGRRVLSAGRFADLSEKGEITHTSLT